MSTSAPSPSPDDARRPWSGDLPLIFERSTPGRRGHALPPLDVPDPRLDALIPGAHLRAEPPALPEVSEPEAVRHYTRLSRRNYSIDTEFYPLGSCTMKHNPRVNETVAAMPGFARLHPLQAEDQVQGVLRVQWELASFLKEITGLPAVTLQPAAGAQGEFTGLLLIRAWQDQHGGAGRDQVLIPDSAHGTNPASVSLVGMKAVPVPSDDTGSVDLDALQAALSERTAAFMITVPSTLGLFDRHMAQAARMVHQAGGQVYMDGANLNALLGVLRPADLGVDAMHINLHKTFSTPHGGGGPGSGPVAAAAHLEPYLPAPVVRRDGDRYYLDRDRPRSVGRVKAFQGNVGMHLRAWAYVRALGAEGLARISRMAVLNANYLQALLKEHYEFPYEGPCMHECVASGAPLKKATGVRTLDVAKRLIDYGFHPPTIYFPLIVKEALMMEPPESEDPRSIRAFADALIRIKAEAQTDPALVQGAPYTTPVGRLDEVRAARRPVLRWYPEGRESPLGSGPPGSPGHPGPGRSVECAPCFS